MICPALPYAGVCNVVSFVRTAICEGRFGRQRTTAAVLREWCPKQNFAGCAAGRGRRRCPTRQNVPSDEGAQVEPRRSSPRSRCRPTGARSLFGVAVHEFLKRGASSFSSFWLHSRFRKGIPHRGRRSEEAKPGNGLSGNNNPTPTTAWDKSCFSFLLRGFAFPGRA